MSSLPAPSTSAKPPVPFRQESNLNPVKRPDSKGLWVAILIGLAMVTLAILWQRRTPRAAASTRVGAIRTATVSSGPVVNTLRLTGVTAAEKFASLITPQLRGSQADTDREGPAARSNDFSLVLRHAVKPGSQVEKGQVVAEFDRQYMLNRVDDYRAVVTQTEADLKKQKS